MRTDEPSGWTLTRMRLNSSGVRSIVAWLIVALRVWPWTAGVPPSWPPEICTFCARIASVTSSGVSAKLVSLTGSSQMRIAYWVPNRFMLPTPGMRESGSWMFEAT